MTLKVGDTAPDFTLPTDGGGYTMDHTAIVYLMGKDGRFVAPFNMKRRPEEAAVDLKRYL